MGEWANRSQFLGVAAQMMRRIVVDHARHKQSEKRRMTKNPVSLDDVLTLSASEDLNLVALDESLSALASFDEKKCMFFLLRRCPPRSALFPATTLFRARSTLCA